MRRSTKDVSAYLDISPVTLRLWCRTFESDIGIWRSDNGRYVYTDEVVRRLRQVKNALDSGLVYEDVKGLFDNGQIDDIHLPALVDANITAITEPITYAIERQGELIMHLVERQAALEGIVENLSQRLLPPVQDPPKTDRYSATISDNGSRILWDEIPLPQLILHRWRIWRARGRGW